eukprot:PLAT4614.1.p3 GENE.PLAT4614.1~~PLAT4614.1.p3  ORF type:complete len:113 (-),score=45.31 PLAT4614.1:108-446(-)
MFGYMTDLDGVDIDSSASRSFRAEGHDLLSLVFGLLDEALYVFNTDGFICKRFHVTSIDRLSWTVHAVGHGELFSLSKHTQGTEVKAITYSNMQVLDDAAKERIDVYVIVDI